MTGRRRVFAALALALGSLGAAPAPDPAPRRGYVGASMCGACHARQLETWRAGPHARAGRSLRGEARRDRRCQACHTTGDAPAGRPAFAGVGCEACHGAGAVYAADDVMRDPSLARALGLRDLSSVAARAAACGSCHRATTHLAPFDAEAAWARIGHGGDAGGDEP